MIITEDKIAALAVPILRRIDVPVSCIEVARLLGVDSSACFRALMNCDQTVATKSRGLTAFAIKP